MSGRFEIKVADDKSKVSIKVIDESGEVTANLSQDDLLSLIKALGTAHAQLGAGKPIPQIEGLRIDGIYDTRWYVNPELMGEASALSFYHPSFGPLGFLVPIDQVERMVVLLNNQIELAKQSRQAQAN